ncbi:hypothetical protein TUM12370_00080 [Salmonella enterica subsp. enterica serovar Choleraesuis]|nr:hypothetical protein TUM12370_00080 [Salmonella enterica subsp. enterica serovar Choleraesuis]
MGLLDQITGLLEGGEAGKYQAILNWVNEQGGVQALLDKFHQGGFSELVTSWLGNGSNHSVDASQIESVIGSPAISDLAGKLGLDPQQASSMLASALPGIIDALSPNGQVQADSSDALLNEGLQLLKNKFFS